MTTYRLVSVVYHHGKLATGGHYTCDAMRASGDWIRFDDTFVERVDHELVFREESERQPYILFYTQI